MNVLGWDYPLHLGVTEVAKGEDGKMKSTIGIGTLLQVSSNDSLPHLCQDITSFSIPYHDETLTYILPQLLSLFIHKTIYKLYYV